MQNTLGNRNNTIKYISFLQFLGPIFVVLGHSLNGIQADGVWWLFTKQWIYIFHMPLFFLISGYLLAYNNWHCKKGYQSFVKSKFVRLIVPYLFWNLLCFAPKFIFQSWLSDDAALDASYLIKAFVAPRQNILGHTWYLFAAFLTYLLSPLWKSLFEKTKVKVGVIAIGIILYILPIKTEFFCLSDLHKDILFFAIGCYFGLLPIDRLFTFCKKYFLLNIICALISSGIAIAFYDVNWIRFIPCYFIIITFFSLPICIKTDNKIINALAINSFAIYIMHWPVMLAVRIALYQILHFPSSFVVFVMILAGYLMPNIVVCVLRKLPENKLKRSLRCILGV